MTVLPDSFFPLHGTVAGRTQILSYRHKDIMDPIGNVMYALKTRVSALLGGTYSWRKSSE